MKNYFSELRRWLRNSVLGKTKTIELPGAEVDELLAKYSAEDVTTELFDFGQMLLTANEERVGLIDSKATTLVGYSSAILALLLMRGATWTHSWLELIAIVIVALAAGSACLFSLMALHGAQNWSQLSEGTWFPRDRVLQGSDSLKRFYISAMHQVLQDNHRIANHKADQMIMAQILVALAGVLLAITLAAAVAMTLVRSITSRPSELYSTSAAPLTDCCAVTCSAYRADSPPLAQYSVSVEGWWWSQEALGREVLPARDFVLVDFPALRHPYCQHSDYRLSLKESPYEEKITATVQDAHGTPAHRLRPQRRSETTSC